MFGDDFIWDILATDDAGLIYRTERDRQALARSDWVQRNDQFVDVWFAPTAIAFDAPAAWWERSWLRRLIDRWQWAIPQLPAHLRALPRRFIARYIRYDRCRYSARVPRSLTILLFGAKTVVTWGRTTVEKPWRNGEGKLIWSVAITPAPPSFERDGTALRYRGGGGGGYAHTYGITFRFPPIHLRAVGGSE